MSWEVSTNKEGLISNIKNDSSKILSLSSQGPTHRLDIEPGYNGDGTCLHVSDLNSAVDGSTDIILVRLHSVWYGLRGCPCKTLWPAGINNESQFRIIMLKF